MHKKRKLVKIKRRHAPGSAPGQVVPPRHAGKPTLNLIGYSAGQIEEKHNVELADIRAIRDRFSVVWIDVTEFGDADLIVSLGETFGLHRLALEDAVNTHQRPKVDDYGDQLFLIARMLHAEPVVETEQVAFFLGDGLVVTFQEKPGDCFEPVRERLRHAKGRVRTAGADYLCYCLIDAIVDAYFPVLERYGETLEDLEDAVVREPSPAHVGELHDMKRDLLMLRRAIWPHREMLGNLIRDDHRTISADTRQFLRDSYDHTIQLMDIVETYREIASSLMDVYISSVSVKLNEVMKVLTLVATVFMPLSFIASLYGMNFDRSSSPWNMPELGWYLGYPFALSLMLTSAVGLIWYSWRRGWVLGWNRK